MTHISYECVKKIKAFLGKEAPEPMGHTWYSPSGMLYTTNCPRTEKESPAYRLEDLLSRGFCEAFVKVGAAKFGFDEDEVTDFVADWSTEIAYAYFNGNLPAVEAALLEMMGRKP